MPRTGEFQGFGNRKSGAGRRAFHHAKEARGEGGLPWKNL